MSGLADADADGATDGDAAADGEAAADGAPPLGAGPKLQDGAPAAWHAATVAATPARPVTPAARRNPRRVSWDALIPRAADVASGVGSAGGVIMGSTGTGSPLQGGRLDGAWLLAIPTGRQGTMALILSACGTAQGTRLLGCGR